MSNLSLLLSCSKKEFHHVVKLNKVKCDELDSYLHCTILYAGDYSSLVKDARIFNRRYPDLDILNFVYVTQKL